MKTKLLWIQGISCNGNLHSFLTYPHLEQFMEDFEFVHHPIIETDTSLTDVTNNALECDILLIDGSISSEFERGGVAITELLNFYIQKAKKVVAIGTCASFGGLFKQSPFANAQGLLYDGENKNNIYNLDEKKIINLSGCPVHPTTIINTLYQIRSPLNVKLDPLHRPVEFYSTTIHNGCTRNEYFEWKIDSFDFGEKEGCMYYSRGCQAPYTSGSCNKILWNEVNSKTRNGSPCFGCNEPTFPKTNLFKTKTNMSIPQYLPIGIPKRAYLSMAGVAKTFKIPRLNGKLHEN